MSKQPQTYLITLEMTSISDPHEWNWDDILKPTPEESYHIYSIGKITNGKEGE